MRGTTMLRLRHTVDWTDLQDPLLGALAIAYILGFVAAVEAALARLAY
jgi:hypothetical protein